MENGFEISAGQSLRTWGVSLDSKPKAYTAEPGINPIALIAALRCLHSVLGVRIVHPSSGGHQVGIESGDDEGDGLGDAIG